MGENLVVLQNKGTLKLLCTRRLRGVLGLATPTHSDSPSRSTVRTGQTPTGTDTTRESATTASSSTRRGTTMESCTAGTVTTTRPGSCRWLTTAPIPRGAFRYFHLN